MDIVDTVAAAARQECRDSQGSLDPRDQRVVRVHPALKAPWDRKASKVTKGIPEVKVPQVPRDLREIRDLKDPKGQRAHKDKKGTQACKEFKDFQGPQAKGYHVTGNSACLVV